MDKIKMYEVIKDTCIKTPIILNEITSLYEKAYNSKTLDDFMNNKIEELNIKLEKIYEVEKTLHYIDSKGKLKYIENMLLDNIRLYESLIKGNKLIKKEFENLKTNKGMY